MAAINHPINLKAQVTSGVFWSIIQTWGLRAIDFFVFFLLARLLAPQVFGLLALATIYVDFVNMLTERGLSDAIVQRETVDPEHLDTVFWMGISFSMLLVIVSFMIAQPAANFFHEPQLTAIIRWLSLCLILTAINSTLQAILQRQLDLKKLAQRSLLAAVGGGIVGITMAVNGYGVWSLVGQILVNRVIGVAFLWSTIQWKPSFNFSFTHLSDLFPFGRNMILTQLLNFFSRRIDDLLIGYFLGSTLLGYYAIAYKTLGILTQMLILSINVVAMPTFARLQKQEHLLLESFKNFTFYSSIITFPVFLLVSLLSKELVAMVYGPQWQNSAPVLQILMFAGLLQSILYYHGSLMIALDRLPWRVWILAINLATNIIGFLLLLRWGIVAIATIYVVNICLTVPLELWLTHKLIDLKMRSYAAQFIPTLVACGAMVATIYYLRHAFFGQIDSYPEFSLLLALGGVVYLLTLYIAKPALATTALTALSAFFSRTKLPVRQPIV